MMLYLSNFTRYVVGFIVDLETKQVVLIRKNRPADQKGKLNGVGGRINVGESPVQAMVREAQEECGVRTTKDSWLQFHYERRLDVTQQIPTNTCLYFYVCVATEETRNTVRTRTDEPVDLYEFEGHGTLRTQEPVVPSLHWLLPMALDYLARPQHRYMEG